MSSPAVTNKPPTFNIDPNVMFIIERVQFGVWCFTVPFYSFVLHTITRAQYKNHPNLATPFFKFVVTSGVIDLVTLINNYIGAVFAKWGLFREIYLFAPSFYAHVYMYIAWSTGICQAMSVSVLASNRLTAMMAPHNHDKYWRGNRFRIAVALQFIPGMLVGVSTFFNETHIAETSTRGLVPQFLIKSMTNTFFAIGGFFLVGNSAYLIVAYCFLFVALRRRNKIQATLQQMRMSEKVAEGRRREFRLFIMSSCVVTVQLFILSFFCFKLSAFWSFSIEQFYFMYNGLSDLYSSVNPYLLLVFSDSLRRQVLFDLGFGRKTSTVVVSSVVNG